MNTLTTDDCMMLIDLSCQSPCVYNDVQVEMLKAARGCAFVSQFYAAFIEGDSHYMVCTSIYDRIWGWWIGRICGSIDA